MHAADMQDMLKWDINLASHLPAKQDEFYVAMWKSDNWRRSAYGTWGGCE